MIQAILHGKLPELENVEDLLTSTVFGTLRYLPPGDALIPFLEKAVLYDQNRTRLCQYLPVKGINLRNYQTVSYVFWPRVPVHGEPDLILLFSNNKEEEPDLLIVVEAKFKSSKSGTGEHDQLKMYYKAIHKHLCEFYQQEIAAFTGIIGPIIYLTTMEANEEVEDTKRELKKEEIQMIHPIFHLRWQLLYKVLEQAPMATQPVYSLIVLDLLSYLKYLNLQEFAGITFPTDEILEIIHRQQPIFYSDKTTKPANLSYFKNLPDVIIQLDKNVFYRG